MKIPGSKLSMKIDRSKPSMKFYESKFVYVQAVVIVILAALLGYVLLALAAGLWRLAGTE